MTTQELAQKLIQFKTTHERMDQIEACLSFCEKFFSDNEVIIKKYISNGIPSLVIQTKDTLDVDVLLLGHIDTIDGPNEMFKGDIEEGKLYGRGSLDMKAFVATSMKVLKNLLDQGYDGNIAVVIVCDEELGGKDGARYLVEDIGYTAKVVLVPDDGENIQNIVVESKHILQYEFMAQGKEAHGCQPCFGKNAIVALIETYKNLSKNFVECLHARDEKWINTINLGKITGGVAANEVPAEAYMHIDIRITNETSKEQVNNWVKDACVEGVKAKLNMEGFPTIIDQEDSLFQSYIKELQSVTGSSANFLKSGGGTDGRYFSQKGMKVIVHQASGGDCQGEREYVEVNSLNQLVKIQENFIKNNF